MYQLENGGSESLRVVPATRRLSFVQFGSAAVGSERMGSTINLHFEGNWMPVMVSVRCGWEGIAVRPGLPAAMLSLSARLRARACLLVLLTPRSCTTARTWL